MKSSSTLETGQTSAERSIHALPGSRLAAAVCFLVLCTLAFASERSGAAENVPIWMKPLAWSNPESKKPAAPELQERSPWLKPMQLRSDAYVEYREDEYRTNEPKFETAKKPFHWSNPADSVASAPQRKLTDAEQVEFEKQNYVWIRPFYWNNKEEYQQVLPWDSLEGTEIGTRYAGQKPSGWLAPFNWTNSPPRMAKRSSSATANTQVAQGAAVLRHLPPVGGTSSRAASSRTVAFMMQEGEQAAETITGDQGTETIPPGTAEGPLEGELPFENWAGGDTEEIGTPGEGLTGDEGEGIIAEAETLGEEPDDSNNLQFLRADTVLLDPGEMQFDYGLTYSLFDIELPSINSSTELEHARFRQRELLTPLEIRYGFTRRLQLFANAPFGWSNVEFSRSDLDLFENDGGFGDLTFGGTFLVRQGNQCCSDIVWTNSCTAPTGIDPFGPSPAGLPQAPSLGNGTWNLASNLLFIRTYDPLVVFYGFGTRQHFTRDLNGQSFRPGQEYNYNMGVGFAVNSKVTFSTRFNGAYVTEARLASQRIQGSIQEPMVVSFALTIAQCNGLVEPFIDFGLTDESLESRFGVIWTRF